MLLAGKLAHVTQKHSTQACKFVVVMVEVGRQRVRLEAVGFSARQWGDVVAIRNEVRLATIRSLGKRKVRLYRSFTKLILGIVFQELVETTDRKHSPLTKIKQF